MPSALTALWESAVGTMDIGAWVLKQEYHFAVPPEHSELDSGRLFLAAMSVVVILATFTSHVRHAFKCWVLPSLQIAPIQVQVLLIAAVVPSLIHVFHGAPSSISRALQALLIGAALVTVGVSYPRRLSATVAANQEQSEHETSNGTFGVLSLLVFRPAAIALLWWQAESGRIGDSRCVAFGTLLLVAGHYTTFQAGLRVRRGPVGDRIPSLSSAYYAVASLMWAWQLQELMCVYTSLWTPQSANLVRVLEVVETAAAVGCVTHLLATQRDPVVQMAATLPKAQDDHREQDILASWCGSWRLRMQAVLLLADVIRPLREAIFEPSGEVWVPLARTEQGADGRAFPREIFRARRAWNYWIASSGMHRAWPGIKGSPNGLKVLPPGDLTETEKRMSDNSALEQRSSWTYVLVDLFTDRVYSKMLSVVVCVMAATSATPLLSKASEGMEDPATVFLLQVCYLVLMWLVLGVLLLGNNTFFPMTLFYRYWATALGIWLMRQTWVHMQQFVVRLYLDGTDMSEAARWVEFSFALLALAGVFLCTRVATQAHDRSDYHQSMMDSLWYATDTVKATMALQDLRDRPLARGEDVLVDVRGDEPVPGRILKNNGDGTCDVILRDGRQYGAMRHIHIRREAPADEEAEEPKEKRLERFKRLFSSAENYPAVLYFGAVLCLPVLLAGSFATMQVAKVLLSKIYRLHCTCCVLAFFMSAYVVPEGPPQPAFQGLTDYTVALTAWRAQGGKGPADPDTLRAMGLMPMNFRWDNDQSASAWDSSGCGDLKAGAKLVAVLSEGRLSKQGTPEFTYPQFQAQVFGATQSVLGGIPVAAQTVQTVDNMRERLMNEAWELATGGSQEGVLTAQAASYFLCETKLMLGGHSLHLSPGEQLIYTMGWDMILTAKDFVHTPGKIFQSNIFNQFAQMMINSVLQEFHLTGLQEAWNELMAMINDPLSVQDPAAKLKQIAMKFFDALSAAPGLEELAQKGAEIIDSTASSLQSMLPMLDAQMNGAVSNMTSLVAEVAMVRTELAMATSGQTTADPAALLAKLQVLLDKVSAMMQATVTSMSNTFNMVRTEITTAGQKAQHSVGETFSQTQEQLQQAAMRSANKIAVGAQQAFGQSPHWPRKLGEQEAKTMSDVIMASPPFQILNQIINILSQDWIPFVLIGVKWGLSVSLLCGFLCQFLVIARCFSKYRELFEQMQQGKHDYPGGTDVSSLKKGFSESTMFPGVLLGTVVMGFVVVTVTVFITLGVVVLTCLPMCIPQWIQPLYPALKYLLMALAMKKTIQLVLLDGLLTDNGDVVYPITFSVFWFVQLILNAIIGISLAVARCAVVLGVSAVACCFIDFTVVPEMLVPYDTGYYALLTTAYTHHQFANPIKNAAVIILEGQAHRIYGRRRGMPRPVYGSPAKRRVRARFWLAVTLHNNPELQRERVHDRLDEGSSFWGGGGTPKHPPHPHAAPWLNPQPGRSFHTVHPANHAKLVC